MTTTKHVLIAWGESGDRPVITSCATLGQFHNAVMEGMFSGGPPYDPDNLKEGIGVAETLLEEGEFAFEGDPPLSYRKEVWPFKLADYVVLLGEERFYAFGDAGGISGSNDGYAAIEELLAALRKDDPDMDLEDDVSQAPEDLGAVAYACLTGREYVDQLYIICGKIDAYGVPYSDDDFRDVYGTWAVE